MADVSSSALCRRSHVRPPSTTTTAAKSGQQDQQQPPVSWLGGALHERKEDDEQVYCKTSAIVRKPRGKMYCTTQVATPSASLVPAARSSCRKRQAAAYSSMQTSTAMGLISNVQSRHHGGKPSRQDVEIEMFCSRGQGRRRAYQATPRHAAALRQPRTTAGEKLRNSICKKPNPIKPLRAARGAPVRQRPAWSLDGITPP